LCACNGLERMAGLRTAVHTNYICLSCVDGLLP